MRNINIYLMADKPVSEKAIKHFQNVIAETAIMMMQEAVKKNSKFVEGEAMTDYEGRFFAISFHINIPTLEVADVQVKELSENQWIHMINLRQGQAEGKPNQETKWIELEDED